MDAKDYMALALKEAQKAFLKDEVPVGAVVVNSKNGQVIAKAYNQTEHGGDPTKHAEILAIQKACKKLGLKRLWNCDMYVSLEPCTMCAAAIAFARIERLFIGTLDEKGGAIINGVRFFESPTCHFKPEIHEGILATESQNLLQSFFKNKRSKI